MNDERCAQNQLAAEGCDGPACVAEIVVRRDRCATNG